MALIDRAIVDADTLVLHGSALTDYASGSSVTSTGSLVDPIVSGSSYAHQFDGTAASESMSIPIKNLNLYKEICIEMSLHYASANSTPWSICKIGTDDLLYHQAKGLLKINLPYTTNKAIFIPYTPDDTTNISINMTWTNYQVMINGVVVASGEVSPSMQFKSNTTISFTSPTPANGTVTFGHLAIYPTIQSTEAILTRLLESVFTTPDANVKYDFESYEFSDLSQDYAVKFDLPKIYPWTDYATDGVIADDRSLRLNLKQVEAYDSGINAYIVKEPADLFGQTQGLVHAYIASYVAAATNRGIIYLKPKRPGLNQYALRFNTGNRVDLLTTIFTLNGSNVDVSSTAITTLSTPSVAIGGGSAVSVGFGWDSTGLYTVYGSTATAVSGGSEFSSFDYEVVFGNCPSTPYGLYDQPTFANLAAWTTYPWQLRLWDTFNPASPTVTVTNWGRHTFFPAEITTADPPVRAQADVNIQVPLPPGLTLRNPFYYVDAELAGTVTEVLT